MPDKKDTQPKLPESVRRGLDEKSVIDAKKKKLKDLGGELNDKVEEALKRAEDALKGGLVEEIHREAKALEKLAGQIRDGLLPAEPVGDNDDTERLKGIEGEIGRIARKLEIARRHRRRLEDENDIRKVERALKALDKVIRQAAIAAAEREVKDLEEEIKRLKDGKPAKRDGKGPGTPPDKQKKKKDKKKDGGGGSSSSSSADADSDSSSSASADAGTASGDAGEIPDLRLIHVRDRNRVWVWNAWIQDWTMQDLLDEIIEVESFDGGLLAYSRRRAAIYDLYLGEWLTPLDSPADDLVEGDAA